MAATRIDERFASNFASGAAGPQRGVLRGPAPVLAPAPAGRTDPSSLRSSSDDEDSISETADAAGASVSNGVALDIVRLPQTGSFPWIRMEAVPLVRLCVTFDAPTPPPDRPELQGQGGQVYRIPLLRKSYAHMHTAVFLCAAAPHSPWPAQHFFILSAVHEHSRNFLSRMHT